MRISAILFVLSIISGYSSSIKATAPVEEIKSVLSKYALHSPTANQLAVLNENNLDLMLEKLDPYSRYIPPTSSPSRKESKDLGIEIFKHKSTWRIRAIPNGPAFYAGLPEIAALVSINNEDISKYSLNKIATLIDKAKQSDTVSIKVSENSDETLSSYFVIPSENLSQSITWQRIDNYLILRISESLTRQTAPAFSAIYRTLANQQENIILDLRGSIGGDLYEALEIASMFIPAQLPLINTSDRYRKINHYKSSPGEKLKSPMGILIDSRTASAAEILAGILKFYRLSNIVGEQSFGKCSSTTPIPLSNGGELWVTNLDIRFPDNSSCTGIGIRPNIKIQDISILRLATILEIGFVGSHP